MSDYIATFFTHFDAISFRRSAEKHGLSCRLAPVPRRVSSSCGTCAMFTADDDMISRMDFAQTEQLIVLGSGGESRTIIDNR